MSYAFRSFIPRFKELGNLGFYELLQPSASLLKTSLHTMLRIVVATLILFHMSLHVITQFMVFGDTAEMASRLFMLLSLMNGVVKHLSINLRSNRIHGLVDTVNGPYFQPSTAYDREVLDDDARTMGMRFQFYTKNVLICALMYNAYPYVDRMMGKPVEIAIWLPFDTQKSPVFELVLIFLTMMTVINAYGQATVDSLVIVFHSQAIAQIKILRHNFENIVEDAEKIITVSQSYGQDTSSVQQNTIGVPQNAILDVIFGPEEALQNEDANKNEIIDDENFKLILKERFEFCVQHYRVILSYIQEVEDVFNMAMIFQFIVAALTTSTTAYNITEMDGYLTIEFAFASTYLLIMLAQLFLYCYYGTLLTFESERLNESIYGCDWTRTSVPFRKLLLFQMTRCNRAVEPTFASIVPLSLGSFMTIVKFSYTLFTVIRQE